MSCTHFTFGFREVTKGLLTIPEAFCEPHDDHMLEHVKEVLPLLVAATKTGTCVVRCDVATLAVQISGAVRGGEAERAMVRQVAREGALTIRAVEQTLENLRQALAAEALEMIQELGVTERLDLVRKLADPDRPRAIALSDDVPFHAYAHARAKDTVDAILAHALSNTPEFPRA